MSDHLPLAGKTGVIFGVANKRSIAWAIAQAWHQAGAKLIFNYQGERLKDNVEELAGTFGAETPIFPCDVGSDEQIESFFGEVKKRTDRIDLLLQSVAFAPRESLTGEFINTTRQAYSIAHDISAYSLVGLSRAALPFMEGNGGSIIAMRFLGGAGTARGGVGVRGGERRQHHRDELSRRGAGRAPLQCHGRGEGVAGSL